MPAYLKNAITERVTAAAKRYRGHPDPMHDPVSRDALINLYALGSIALAAQTISRRAVCAGRQSGAGQQARHPL